MSATDHRQIPVDAEFDLLDLHALEPARYPHLLESCLHGAQGRFDILFALPGKSLKSDSGYDDDFLHTLDRHWNNERLAVPVESDLPFRGGWFVYLSYELAAQIEPGLDLPATADNLPVASATRFPAAIIHDHKAAQRWLVVENEADVAVIQHDLARLSASRPAAQQRFTLPVREDRAQTYLNGVDVILDYIREGDVFQVNLSRAWEGNWPQNAENHEIYRQLRASNPGPFNGLATWGNTAVFSSSPERLVEVRGRCVQTRPIAGTRPRGHASQRDNTLIQELLKNPKEQAEHIMLIDLERNDLGRVAVPGSVRVNELMALESYSTVHHIVSNVQARLRDGVTPGDVIRAVFPGGTITGCPKVRCMEIIAELEKTGRGAYTGSLGYLNHDGSMDLNILIRTMVRSGNRLGFRAGAGIVADSVASHELEETRVKAQGMLRSLQGEQQ